MVAFLYPAFLLMQMSGTSTSTFRRADLSRQWFVEGDAGETDPFIVNLRQNIKCTKQQFAVVDKLIEEGLLGYSKDSSNLQAIFRAEDSEHVSSILIDDFDFPEWMAHHTRDAIIPILHGEESLKSGSFEVPEGYGCGEQTYPRKPNTVDSRRGSSFRQGKTCGLSADDQRFPLLMDELKDFHHFTTHTSDLQQEAPIKPATADVYMRHVRLFLGWFIQSKQVSDQKISLKTVFLNKESDSIGCIVDFVNWLRHTRKIAASYEANLLQGIIKLVKYRFADESDKIVTHLPYDDIPAVVELRKLLRQANAKAKASTRPSATKLDVLKWRQYAKVITSARSSLTNILHENESKGPKKKQGREVAIRFQNYLILQLFTKMADKQRIIQELEIDRSFVRDEKGWLIHYEAEVADSSVPQNVLRVPYQLSAQFDEFIKEWKPLLSSSKDVFVQPITGKPLTEADLHGVVESVCLEFSGKQICTALLSDMIVRHRGGEGGSPLPTYDEVGGHAKGNAEYKHSAVSRRVEPAIEILKTMNRRLATGPVYKPDL